MRLESLESFKENKLSETHQSNVFGGVGPTAGGEICCAGTDTGCLGFTSDNVDSDGLETYAGQFEVEKDCGVGDNGGSDPIAQPTTRN